MPQLSLQQLRNEILPHGERRANKHNRNYFKLDENRNGSAEPGTGNKYLLPDWTDRYFGMICAPLNVSPAENISDFANVEW